MDRCVVFDFDGTLVESNGIKRQSFYDVAAELGDVSDAVSASITETVGDRTAVMANLVRRLAADGRLPSVRPAASWSAHLVERYTALCEERIAVCPEVRGATAAVAMLRDRGIPAYINSATPETPLLRVVELRGMKDRFRGVYGGPATKVANLLSIARREKSDVTTLVFVGDQEVDRAAAVEVGCAFVGVRNELSEFRVLPDVLLDDLTDLSLVLDRLAPATGAAS